MVWGFYALVFMKKTPVLSMALSSLTMVSKPNPTKIMFSRRWFEVDPGYILTKILSKLKILRLKNA